MKKRYTVVFLADQYPPKQLLLLQRGADRPFAPNRFTGIGGKIELGENPKVAALRELMEETQPPITDIPIVEFGRVIINDNQIIHYYAGLNDGHPLPSSNEGTLFRTPINEVFATNLIPTTRWFMEKWAERLWDITKPFTMYLSRFGDIDSRAEDVRVVEGLEDLP